ncbi:hypothetical protein AK88_03600 [Plasmodium fragile]|uniref:Palmitoyltransferase n=1 Tax=Plasmodium fragile TaxID=5857 RepID=A0A0D9QM29_PLAFR|nr:uncharacterized protein AK88_03600 [Plasmodium fragile]KJP86786.1 hypothetical protein AK88_03600 [Plasmodium fragile]
MKNPLPFAVVSIKLSVLATLAHLVRTGQLPYDGRTSFFFLFFLYAASFSLYVISSLRDPGYVKSCPLAYLPNDERAAFKASLSERTQNKNEQTKNIPIDVSITHDEFTSSDSFSSDTVSTNGELDSLTIIHHKNHNTIITERRIKKKQKGLTMRCVRPDQPHEDRLVPSTNKTKYAHQEGSRRERGKCVKRSHPQAEQKRVHPRLKTSFSWLHNLHLMAPLEARTRVNVSGPSKYKPLAMTQLHHMRCNCGESHAGPTHVKQTIGHSLEYTPITCPTHVKMKPSAIFRVLGGEVYQYATPLSYCYVCGVVQILRSKHCNACHKCVRTFDHHCPWINNCVAENNRASYLVYLLLEAMTLFHAIRLLSRVLLKMLFEEHGWFFAWLVVLLLVLFFFFTMISCLAIYHSYLCLINETTRENTVRARSTPEVNTSGRQSVGPFFLGYQQNVLIYFSNLPIVGLCPQVVRQYVSSKLCRTRGVAWGTQGEILWKPNPKSRLRREAIFLSILEHVAACVRRQFSPVTLSTE